jgi:putative DNA primase/helicase
VNEVANEFFRTSRYKPAEQATPAASFPPEREGEGPPVDGYGDQAVIAECAKLDHSDTDNAQRLIAHFGRDLAVVARDQHAGGDYLAWEGRFWDFSGGAARSILCAQKIGGLIAREAESMSPSREERAAISAAEVFPADDDSPQAKKARAAASEARAALQRRKSARWRFAVSSKNAARVKNMLEMAAPHLRRPSAEFNRDPLLVASRNATLRFKVSDDPECPDPDVTRRTARVESRQGHDRADYVTGLVSADYDPNAKSPKWNEFLERCLPDPEVRRTVQVYSSMGLLGLLAQKLMFHYGAGANGKSVFLATLGAVLGPSLGVSLPKETIIGQGERGAGQASPDLVRLFGKRFVRIDELKEGESLREDLVKRLTGGDVLVVRDLFRGYLEFPNVATPHMVGNGYPRIDGTDEGIWRRMLVVRWGVTIPEAERKPFDALVAELLGERSGVLNWLIEGARDFLANGLFIAEAASVATRDFREDMDPIGRFVSACVTPQPAGRVQARALYEAYKSWSMANALTVRHETPFGREMKKRFPRDDRSHTRAYLGIELHDVPARPDLLAEGAGL